MIKGLRRLFAKTEKRINEAINNGDVFKANEIQSNLTLSGLILLLNLSTLLSLVLNEIGVFHLPLYLPRFIFVVSMLIDIPLLIINYKTKGESKWMRAALIWGNLLIVTLVVILCGYYAEMLLLLPMILTIRYCDEKFTKKVVIISAVLCFIAFMLNAALGDVNLNIFVADRVHAFVNLDEPLYVVKMEKIDYYFNMFLMDCLPALLALTVVGIACVRIAGNGKDMISLQQKITMKTSRIDTELNLAMELQASMLPCTYPAFPDHPNIDLYAFNTPAKEMGGDFYDFFRIDDNHVMILMADVSGKGIGAAFFMAIAKSALRYCIRYNATPARVLENTNQYLCENNETGLFVTCWFGIYEVSTHKLTYANAGHNHPIIIKKDGSVDFLKSKTGFVLAGLDTVKYTDYEIDLNVGDEIVLYTDGVTEANNKDMELFGDDRLLREMHKVKDLATKQQIEHVVSVLDDYMKDTEQFDDITMLAMKIN